MKTYSKHQQLLVNRYQLCEILGTGAMGQVYLAQDKLLGSVTVAVKFLSQALLNAQAKERFEREATISALLGEKSSHIVKVRDYGLDSQQIPFYVMEYLSGNSLSAIIKSHPLKLSRFLKLSRQICFGLDCAHKGLTLNGEFSPIIHRDIKPSNILIVQDTALGELVKILDFGIATLAVSSVKQIHTFMGTLAYCSPEQMEDKDLDARSDIYSLGIMMYKMLSGNLPIFPEDTSFGGWYEAHHHAKPQPFPAELEIPRSIEQLILGCLAKSCIDRPQSIREILMGLGTKELGSLLGKTETAFLKLEAPVALSREEKKSDHLALSIQEVCSTLKWPSDKPIQKIVFPQIIASKKESAVSLYAMLDWEDIIRARGSIRYNQFLLVTEPHPMVLWITVLYQPSLEPRWLPCYLNLKTPTGQQVLRLLGSTGSYWILFFAVDEPSRCQFSMNTAIAPKQCELLTQWANSAQSMTGGQSQETKRILRQEFEQLKPTILVKLKASRPKQF
jgi:serine/threonine-protein kinase